MTELDKTISSLSDLNQVTRYSQTEFKGLTKRLISMSDNISGAGKKWTIFSRIVSGSPLWKIQNKVRAFVDSLAMIEQSSKANAEAQEKADQQVMNMVKSMKTLQKTIEVVDSTQAISTKTLRHGKVVEVKSTMSVTDHILKQKEAVEDLLQQQKAVNITSTEHAKITKEIGKVIGRTDKELDSAIDNNIEYNKALLLGASSAEAYTIGLQDLIKKGEAVNKTFEGAKDVAKLGEVLNRTFDVSQVAEYEKAVGAAKGVLKATEKEFKDRANEIANVLIDYSNDPKQLLVDIQGEIEDKAKGFAFKQQQKFQKRLLKYQAFMQGLGKTAKPILNYIFKTMVLVTLGVLGFLILARFLYNAIAIGAIMGVFGDIKDIAFLAFGILGNLMGVAKGFIEGDINSIIENLETIANRLIEIGLKLLLVGLKMIFALAVSVVYTAIDLVIGFIVSFFESGFQAPAVKAGLALIVIFFKLFVIKSLLIAAFHIAAMYALPILFITLGIAALTGLVMFAISKIRKAIKNAMPSFMAEGGVSGGGLTVVGEQGPELVNLPKGARVHSNADSKKMVGGTKNNVVNNHVNVTINAKDTSDAELRRIAEQVGNMISIKMNRSVSSSGFVR